MKEFFIFIVLLVTIEGYKDYDIDEVLKIPHFEHYRYPLPNNSYIYSRDIANHVDGALLCKNSDKSLFMESGNIPMVVMFQEMTLHIAYTFVILVNRSVYTA